MTRMMRSTNLNLRLPRMRTHRQVCCSHLNAAETVLICLTRWRGMPWKFIGNILCNCKWNIDKCFWISRCAYIASLTALGDLWKLCETGRAYGLTIISEGRRVLVQIFLRFVYLDIFFIRSCWSLSVNMLLSWVLWGDSINSSRLRMTHGLILVGNRVIRKMPEFDKLRELGKGVPCAIATWFFTKASSLLRVKKLWSGDRWDEFSQGSQRRSEYSRFDDSRWLRNTAQQGHLGTFKFYFFDGEISLNIPICGIRRTGGFFRTPRGRLSERIWVRSPNTSFLYTKVRLFYKRICSFPCS